MRDLIALAAACCFLGCSTLGLGMGETTPTAPEGARFAVLLTNALVPTPTDLEGAPDRVVGRILRYLRAHGLERLVIERPETEPLWRESIALASESETVSHDFYGAMRIFARKLRGASTFDGIVVSSLVYREGWLHNGVVKWDGAVRRLPETGEEDEKMIPSWFEAKVPVVSLHVMVFSAAGELLFENYGGIDLVHSLRLDSGEEGRLQAELLDPVLAERRFLREGVELAFEPYLPRDRTGEW